MKKIVFHVIEVLYDRTNGINVKLFGTIGIHTRTSPGFGVKPAREDGLSPVNATTLHSGLKP